MHLLDAKGEAAVLHINLQHLGLDGFALAQDFAGMLGLFRPAQVADVHQALHALFDLEEGAEIGHAAHAPGDDGAHRILVTQGEPGIRQGLLHAQRDAALLGVYLQHFDFELVSDGHDF